MSENKTGITSLGEFYSQNNINKSTVMTGVTLEQLKAFKAWALNNKDELVKINEDTKYRKILEDNDEIYFLALYLEHVASKGEFENLDKINLEYLNQLNSNNQKLDNSDYQFNYDDQPIYDSQNIQLDYDDQNIQLNYDEQNIQLDYDSQNIPPDVIQRESVSEVLRAGSSTSLRDDKGHGNEKKHSDTLFVPISDPRNKIGANFELSTHSFDEDFNLKVVDDNSPSILKKNGIYSLANSRLLDPLYLNQVAELAKLSGDEFVEIVIPKVLGTLDLKMEFADKMKRALLDVGFPEDRVALPDLLGEKDSVDSSNTANEYQINRDRVSSAIDSDGGDATEKRIIKTVLSATENLSSSFSLPEFAKAVSSVDSGVSVFLQEFPDGEGFGLSYSTFGDSRDGFSHNIGSLVGSGLIGDMPNIIGANGSLMKQCSLDFNCSKSEMMSHAIQSVIEHLAEQKNREVDSIHFGDVKNAISKGLDTKNKGFKFTSLKDRDEICRVFNIQISGGYKKNPDELIISFYNSNEKFKLADVFPVRETYTYDHQESQDTKKKSTGMNKKTEQVTPKPESPDDSIEPMRTWEDNAFKI
ncbi:hypothetical protein [Photobacterium kishitanii]|uniref:Uncharacterized protein n=1 Tax=Photobacterium kishitanii TaxID=318456 RepID=A0A2T3KMB9_9GAMM|nr:hypothetical protein [Photobacterium kishitanii]PSV00922.1 hypothetical protein C9J27_02525 [Photobacterium kishitanii]